MYFSFNIEPLIHYLKENPAAGKIAALLISFLESVPIIGTIIPGSVTMTALGALVGSAVIPLDSTFLFAVIGALAGDTLGYWLGATYHEQIRNIWPFNKKQEWLNYGERFFKKHGGKSILLGRFVGPMRSTMPLVAGVLRMKTPIFIIAAVPSAFLWAILYMVPGILIGALSMELPKGQAAKFIVLILVLLIAFWLTLWLIKHVLSHLTRLINNGIDYSWKWLQTKKPTHYFIELITNQNDRNDHAQLTLAILAVLGLSCFFALAISVLSRGELTHLNNQIFFMLQSLHTPLLNYLAVGVTLLAQKPVILGGAVLFSAWLAFHKNWYTLCHWIALIALSVVSVGFFKWVIYSPRPIGLTHQATNYSFPSGHCLLAYTIYGFLAYLFSRSIKGKWHYAIYTLATVLILSIATSRLYLGAHWLSDVVGSLFLGTAILLTIICAHRRRSHISVPIKQYNVVVLISFLVPWAIYNFFGFKHQLANYQPYWPTYSVSTDIWWQKPLALSPTYRNNRFGEPIQPFNIQWAGDLSSISTTLKHDNWKTYGRPTTLKGKLERIGSLNPKAHMPLLPSLYRGKPPTITFIKPIPNRNSEMELRLWQSGITLTPNKTPVWIGNITFHHGPKKLLALKTKEKSHFIAINVTAQLKHDSKEWQQKYLHARVKLTSHPWDGTIILIRKK